MPLLSSPGGDMFRAASNPMQLDGSTSSNIIITQASALAQKAIVINNTSGGAVPIAFEYQIAGTPVFDVTASAIDTTLRINAEGGVDLQGTQLLLVGNGGITFNGTGAADTVTNLGISAGGSSLPTWTFSAAGGDPTAGQFKTNNAAPGSTTSIRFHGTTVGGATGFDSFLATGLAPALGFVYIIILTNTTTGQQQRLDVSAAADSGTFATLTVGPNVTTADAWSGTYSLSYYFVPQAQVVYTVDGNAPDGAGAVGSTTPTLAAVLTASGITPIGDGTVTPLTSITTDDGVITAAS